MVQWLRLGPLTAKVSGSILGQGTKILQALQCGQKIKNEPKAGPGSWDTEKRLLGGDVTSIFGDLRGTQLGFRGVLDRGVVTGSRTCLGGPDWQTLACRYWGIIEGSVRE